jgi:hypothetical protein
MSEKRCGGPYKLYRRVVVVVDALVHIVYRNRFCFNAFWTWKAQRCGAVLLVKRTVEECNALRVTTLQYKQYMESIERLLPSERRWFSGAERCC